MMCLDCMMMHCRNINIVTCSSSTKIASVKNVVAHCSTKLETNCFTRALKELQLLVFFLNCQHQLHSLSDSALLFITLPQFMNSTADSLKKK